MIRVTRQQARDVGDKYYFTGEPCGRGHIRVRSVRNGGCKGCAEITIRRWKKKNSAKTRKWYADYKARNVDKVRKAGRERARAKAGLPAPTRAVPATCECCSRPPGRRALALDHCHTTGNFRGWLCWLCNSAIGKLGDTSESVGKAVAYLKRAGS